MLKELVTRQTPDHAGRALTSVAEFDYLMSKIKDSRGHKGRFISAWRAHIVAFLPPLSLTWLPFSLFSPSQPLEALLLLCCFLYFLLLEGQQKQQQLQQQQQQQQ